MFVVLQIKSSSNSILKSWYGKKIELVKTISDVYNEFACSEDGGKLNIIKYEKTPQQHDIAPKLDYKIM